MGIIPKKTEKKPFELAFFLKNCAGVEWIDKGLPVPSYLYHTQQGHIIVMWLISGYFSTKKNTEFLNDIIARFLITFAEEKAERTKLFNKSEHAHIFNKTYGLKEFSKKLKSLKTKQYIPKRAESFEDFTFWAIKLFCEDMIEKNGIATYEQLENFAFSNFEHKEKSTLRAKCRSVWNWYADKDFQLNKKQRKTLKEHLEDTEMTRTQHILKINKRRAENSKAKIEGLINGLFSNDYKKKSGSWHISKIAKDLNLNRDTVSKYLN